jgi:hypothetical protein
VGNHPVFELLRAAAANLAARQAAPGSVEFLKTQSDWDPLAFIDLCEASRQKRSATHLLCRQIQQKEWELLFEYCYARAIGAA